MHSVRQRPSFAPSLRSARGASALMLAVLLPAGAMAQTRPLPDTGQIVCYNASGPTGTVDPTNPNPVQTGFEGQDCVRGAAAADAVDAMHKLGGSTRPGADYTKIANDGSELPASAALGTGPSDWACTRDNITGLIWEVKLDDAVSLRHVGHTYTWYDTDDAVNGGNPGTLGSNTTCTSTLINCNTTAYRDAINALTGSNRLCGGTDWRLPTGNELSGLVHAGLSSGPMIDNAWFPNTANASYWAGENSASGASNAWFVAFNSGVLATSSKDSSRHVRLVRGGQ